MHPTRSSRQEEQATAGEQASQRRGQRRRRDVGRGEWSRNKADKRARHDPDHRSAKRRRVGTDKETLPVYATRYSTDEIAAQDRQPKRKVAVLLGYSGSGYKGMQLNHQERTIEGDLFRAFVAAGAISKANADDPKKSSLVRCARTDKGVHAAGNVISLKLVIEDPSIVDKINTELPPQIRVWGIEQTNKSFSAYQVCDSRIYEYLIPTYCFLPPHPHSFLGQQIVELAEEENDLHGLQERQAEVADFWDETQEQYLKPVIDSIEPLLRADVLKRFHNLGYLRNDPVDSHIKKETDIGEDVKPGIPEEDQVFDKELANKPEQCVSAADEEGNRETTDFLDQEAGHADACRLHEIEEHVRSLKSAQAEAKRAWRIPQARLDRVRSIFRRFVGSIKYHNYTVDKKWQDPSAIRVIKSFKVDEKPIIIGKTEWLSLKVHGQSFMMHQIRKMVSAATLVVRCGCHQGRLQDTFLKDRLSVPKAPSLGLLLERPVFDKYNEKLLEFGREVIDFGKHEKKISEFKQREIYERIFRVEEKEGVFLSFWAGLDSTRSASLLWATSAGLRGTQKDINPGEACGLSALHDLKQVEEEDEHGAQEDS